MGKESMSDEEKLIAAGMRLHDPVGRRVFMQLAAAAGVAVPVGAAAGFIQIYKTASGVLKRGGN